MIDNSLFAVGLNRTKTPHSIGSQCCEYASVVIRDLRFKVSILAEIPIKTYKYNTQGVTRVPAGKRSTGIGKDHPYCQLFQGCNRMISVRIEDREHRVCNRFAVRHLRVQLADDARNLESWIDNI